MQEKYGFVYIWFDRKHKRYYVGCHWGSETDGYICSSSWMKKAYRYRPDDFKRRILKTKISSRKETFEEEYRWLSKIKEHELKQRYYNLHNHHFNHWSATDNRLTVGEKISASPLRGQRISESLKGITLEQRHGKEKADQIKQHLRSINLGKKQSSATVAKKIAATTGRKRSSETCMKMSDSAKKKPKETLFGGNPCKGYTMLGRKHSDETKQKMREARKNINNNKQGLK